MSIERAKEILKQIRDFGHVEGCNSSAPVYECGCYEKDQSELAKEALEELDDRDSPEETDHYSDGGWLLHYDPRRFTSN